MPPFSPELQPIAPKSIERPLSDRIQEVRESLESLANEYAQLYSEQNMSLKPPKELLGLFADAAVKVGGFTTKESKSKDVTDFLLSAWYDERTKNEGKTSEAVYDALSEAFPRGKKYEPGVHAQDVQGASTVAYQIGGLGGFDAADKIRKEFFSRERVIDHLRENEPAVFATYEDVMRRDLPDLLKESKRLANADETVQELFRNDLQDRLITLFPDHRFDLRKGSLKVPGRNEYVYDDIPLPTAIDSQEELLENPKLMDQEVVYERRKRIHDLREARFATQFMARLKSAAAGRRPSREIIEQDPELQEIERIIESAPKTELQEIAHFHSRKELMQITDRMHERWHTGVTVAEINPRIREQLEIPTLDETDAYGEFSHTIDMLMISHGAIGDNFEQMFDRLVRKLMKAEQQADITDEKLKIEVRQKAEDFLLSLKKKWTAKKDLDALSGISKKELLPLLSGEKHFVAHYTKMIENIYQFHDLKD